MVDTILSVVSGILSYLLGSFGSAKFFHPGLEEAFGAWKVFFAFIAVGSIFLGKSRRGLILIFVVGLIAAAIFGLNYKSNAAIPPIASATDISWFAFQLAQGCIVGALVRLAADFKELFGKTDKKKTEDKDKDKDAGGTKAEDDKE
jgi:hypothetical protein